MAKPDSRSNPRSAPVAGTTVLLHFNEEGKQYANSWRLQEIVKKYSNHIAFPIFLTYDKSEWNAEEKKSIKTRTTEQVNVASALWRRPKSEITDEDTRSSTNPSPAIPRTHSSGFTPKPKEAGIHHAFLCALKGSTRSLPGRVQERASSSTSSASSSWTTARELLPQYLRFVRGIIDSEDLPLNVSREILQQNRVLTTIRTSSVKKILSELKNIAASQPEQYLKFIAEYNRPSRKASTATSRIAKRCSISSVSSRQQVEGLTSLAEVKSRMKEGQKSIYYITGGAESLLRTSPLLEIYKKKNLEVLILDDDLDEIVFSGIEKYGDIDLKAVNKSSTSEDLKDEAEPDKAEALKPLLDKLKATLGDRVKDVRASVRLADSPSCIVSDEEEPSMQMQQMLRAMGQKEIPAPKPTLEINPDHEIVKKLLARKSMTLL
jgi:molecular chaperone HtpG